MNNAFFKKTSLVIIIFFCSISVGFAKKNATNKIIIDHPTSYKNITLDLSEQSFFITNNATLTIENCIINGIISPDNPILFYLLTGEIIFKNNSVSIIAKDITPDPTIVSIYNVFKIDEGKVTLSNNQFNIDKLYSVGGLVTGRAVTQDLVITDNTFYQFHGGVLLNNTKKPLIKNNSFLHVSGSNIYLNADTDSNIQDNTIISSGNGKAGDAIDVTDSSNTNISNNYIGDGSCYAILIVRCENLNIHNNRIVGDITYAVYINSSLSLATINGKYLSLLNDQFRHPIRLYSGTITNFNISVTDNYLAQNRYGLAVQHTQGLNVKNNVFIQYFSTAEARRFWTNNNILITDTTDIIWQNNLYKEAYSQVNGVNNPLAQKFFVFPEQGGVIIR
jgi:hypothetical protein